MGLMDKALEQIDEALGLGKNRIGRTAGDRGPRTAADRERSRGTGRDARDTQEQPTRAGR